MNRLLPFPYKITGLCIVICATILSVVYFVYGLRITIPVSAVLKVEIAKELILLLFITGLFMITFSKEKDERHCLRSVRIKAANQTIFIYILWMAFSVIFVFGNGFIFILMINIILPFIIYLTLFYSKKNRALKKRRLHLLRYKILRPITNLDKE